MAELIAHTPQHAILETSGYIGEPTGTIEITENGEYNVKQYANADVNVPQPSGETVLTENNTTYNVAQYESAKVQIPEEEKTVTPTTSQQIVAPTNGLLKKVTVEGVTSSIDPDIQPENIRQGVEILGVEGTLDPTDPRFKNLITGSITEVNDDTITSIRQGAFNNCLNLSRVYFEAVSQLNNLYFDNCPTLVSIDLPNVTSVVANGLRNLYSLKNVNLPKLVSTQTQLFINCTSLEEIVFQSLTYIGNSSCFLNCTKLKTIVLSADTVCTLYNINNFLNTPFRDGTGGIVYVPRNLISEYQTATNWSALESVTFLPIEGSKYEQEA